MTNFSAPAKPLPTPQPESDFYWGKARQHELWLMHCDDCGSTYFYPRPICPECFSRNTRWLQSSGKGTLYAFAIVHRPPSPAFGDVAPYVAAFVVTDEGARIPTNLVDVQPDPAAISIDMPVEVVFEDVNEQISLPKFRPA
jgi:uncharacterized OB-fold protein